MSKFEGFTRPLLKGTDCGTSSRCKDLELIPDSEKNMPVKEKKLALRKWNVLLLVVRGSKNDTSTGSLTVKTKKRHWPVRSRSASARLSLRLLNLQEKKNVWNFLSSLSFPNGPCVCEIECGEILSRFKDS